MKAPKGYEVAPDDYVLREDVDLGPHDTRSKRVVNANGERAPKGLQWVSGWAGQTAKWVTDYWGGQCFRPKFMPVPAKCRHERCYSGVVDGYQFRWCRDCGSFFHPTRCKWLKAGGM